MTVAELVSIIGSVAAMLASLGALVTALASYARLGSVHNAVNGQFQAMIDLTHSSAFAAGQLAGPEAPFKEDQPTR